jgi:hypothetical protein
MSRGNTWTNNDGIDVGFSTRDTHNIEDAVVHTLGRVKQLEIRIDNSTIAGLASATAPGSKAIGIPARSTITRSTFTVIEAFDALTTFLVGTKGSDGVAEDANGLHDAVALAEVDAIGNIHVGDGAQIMNILNTDEELYISLDITGTAPTVGQAVLLVEYIEPVPTQEAPDVITGDV